LNLRRRRQRDRRPLQLSSEPQLVQPNGSIALRQTGHSAGPPDARSSHTRRIESSSVDPVDPHGLLAE